ncbi:DNA adenine methylase [Salmonirosea aquatica]|uniref:DNA adenine methylase n=1 Tax=Salmonirosea aquatica TaxID=2654236 RepID=A0A7C9FFZ3_9BACT|nr:DNA adenine methylase [Cytophagaceae bacterium SJW1-29]MPR37130.1 DNA adenine methylase [Cytophagaceae bacterium SJW1-29]
MKKENQIFRTYPGGKNGQGVFHNIINVIRPHSVYMELFAGSGAIFQYKRPALYNLINDIDPEVSVKWRGYQIDGYGYEVLQQDATEFLSRYPFQESEKYVIYLDPPYPRASRKSSRDLYRYEMTDAQHVELLQTVLSLSAPHIDFVISTYQNPIYSYYLKDWELKEFQAQTRKGPATELLYMNYENHLGYLHQYDFLGEDFTDRQRIKRKIHREIKKLYNLPATERNAIIQAVLTCRT